MSDYKNHYTSTDLSLNQAHSYKLLLQVDAALFDYAVIAGDQLLAWGEGFPLDELKEQQMLGDILTANYRQVIVGLASAGFTLVPNNLFEAEKVADIARLLDVSDSEKVYWQQLDSVNKVVYKADEHAAASSKEFDNAVINFKAKGWIKAIAGSNPANSDLHLNIAGDCADFVYFSNGNLRFYNHFTFKNDQELSYFCALVANELKLDARETNLVLSGDVNENDGNFTYPARFFNRVRLNTTNVLELPDRVPSHKVLYIAALSLCASSEED